jgi:hypothetical protein
MTLNSNTSFLAVPEVDVPLLGSDALKFSTFIWNVHQLKRKEHVKS